LDLGKHFFFFAAAQLAFQYDANRPLESPRQIDFGSGQSRQRQAGEFLGQQIDCVIAEYVHCRPSWQHAHEAEGKSLLDRVKVVEKLLAVDVMNVHGGSLAPY
jgi:hypothetical protein